MGCDCFSRFIKTIVGVINGVIIIAAALGGGLIYANFQKLPWLELLETELPAQFILAVAIIAVISAFIGFFALCCERGCGGKWCRIAYLVIILVVIILEVVCGVVAYMYGDDLIEGIGKNWDIESAQATVALVEKSFECCGFNKEAEVARNLTICGFEKADDTTKWCYQAVMDSIEENLNWIFAVGIVLAVLEVLLLISAIYLRCTVQKKDADLEGIAKF